MGESLHLLTRKPGEEVSSVSDLKPLNVTVYFPQRLMSSFTFDVEVAVELDL